MFSSFAAYDDEGYVLISLRAFAHHGGLYTHVYSQYGPFYYEAWSTIFSWLPLTLDTGRLATLVIWVLASLGFGVAIKVFTGNLLAGLATQLGASILLLSFVDQSMHPAGLMCLMFAVALLSLGLIGQGRRSVGFVMLGAAVGALVLIKVNTGVFAGLATLFAGSVSAPERRGVPVLRVLAITAFVATPLLLAGSHFTERWVTEYVLIVTFSAAATAVVAVDRRMRGLIEGRDALRFLLGGGLLGAAVLAIAILSGTRPLDLMHGALIDPIRLPEAFTFPLSLHTGVDLWGAACLAGAIWFRRYKHRTPAAGMPEALVRMTAGLLIVYCAVVSQLFEGTLNFTVALPLLFLAVVPPVGTSDSERFARTALVALAVLESLIAYPVAGSQIQLSALLVLPVGIVCVHDGIRQLRPEIGRLHRPFSRIVMGTLASVALVAGITWLGLDFGTKFSNARATFRSGSSMTLPGTDLIHLPKAETLDLSSLSNAIRRRCSTFISLPGMNSLYFFTREDPPTTFNTTTWMYLLDGTQQNEIVREVIRQHRSRLCVVDSPGVLAFWEEGRPLPMRPLVRYVLSLEAKSPSPEVFGGYRLFAPEKAMP
jgi:hypothetical protein